MRRDLKKAVNEKGAVRTLLQNKAEAIKEHAKNIDSVVRQYAGSKIAQGITMGLIAWTDLKELILSVDLITWKKGDRPKNQGLIELAISIAQKINVHNIVADSFFATRHLFENIAQAGILAVVRFRSNISVFVAGYGKFQLRNYPAFRFDPNERCMIRTVT